MAVAAAFIVATVFAISGALKLFSPLWPAQAREMGAPRPVAVALPWVEVALGSLVFAGVARQGMLALMALLLVAFTWRLVALIRVGRRPPCACFGRLSRPVGWGSVVRNVVLVSLTLAALVA